MTSKTEYTCDRCGDGITNGSMVTVAPGTVKYINWERLSPDLHFHVMCYETLSFGDIQARFDAAEEANWERLAGR